MVLRQVVQIEEEDSVLIEKDIEREGCRNSMMTKCLMTAQLLESRAIKRLIILYIPAQS